MTVAAPVAEAHKVVAAAPASIADVAAVVDSVDPDLSAVDPAAPVRPDDLPEDLWDATAGAPKYADIKTRLEEAAALKAATEAAAAEAFTAVDTIEWASDVKLADGADIQFDTADPFLQAVGSVVVEHKIPKPAFKAMLNAFAQSQIESDVAAKAELSAEFTALGDSATATARVKGVEAFVQTAFEGNDKLKAQAPALAAAFVRTLNKASQVQAIEALMAHFKDPNPGTGGEGDANATLRATNPGALIFGKKAA